MRNRIEPEKSSKLRKYRTRQSLKDMFECSNSSFDTPSTSTGITGSSSAVFRVVEQDSDEDVPENLNNVENNLINILPTPLNGTHDLYINVLEMNNGATGKKKTDNLHYRVEKRIFVLNQLSKKIDKIIFFLTSCGNMRCVYCACAL